MIFHDISVWQFAIHCWAAIHHQSLSDLSSSDRPDSSVGLKLATLAIKLFKPAHSPFSFISFLTSRQKGEGWTFNHLGCHNKNWIHIHHPRPYSNVGYSPRKRRAPKHCWNEVRKPPAATGRLWAHIATCSGCPGKSTKRISGSEASKLQILQADLLVDLRLCVSNILLVHRQHRTRGEPFGLVLKKTLGLLAHQPVAKLCPLKILYQRFDPLGLAFLLWHCCFLVHLVFRVQSLQHVHAILHEGLDKHSWWVI